LRRRLRPRLARGLAARAAAAFRVPVLGARRPGVRRVARGPGIGDLHDWWQRLDRARTAGDPDAAALHDHYRFLPDVLPARPGRVTRRAEATFALESDL